MKLPGSVKVGAWTYEIQEWTPNEGRAQDKYGMTVHSLQRIQLDVNYGYQRTAATLLHEILHAIYRQWEIQEADKQEHTIELLESGLCTVWRDNPEVMRWIHTGLTSKTENS